MLNQYNNVLKNEILSKLSVIQSDGHFKVVCTVTLDKPVKLNYGEIYEKMFATRGKTFPYVLASLSSYYGNLNQESTKQLELIINGDFEGVKSRNEEAIKLLKYLLNICEVLETQEGFSIISNVRSADEEFKLLRLILQKFLGVFKKEDSDRFHVISKIYEHFKDRQVRLFNPLIQLYNELGRDVSDYKTAIKVNKKLTNKIISTFNDNEARYIEVLKELASTNSKLFGDKLLVLLDLLEDKISDDDIDKCKHLLSFYFNKLDRFIELIDSDFYDICTKYSTVDDDILDNIRLSISQNLVDGKIIQEKLVKSNQYFIVFECNGGYENVYNFIRDNGISSYSILMKITSSEILKNKSTSFLVNALYVDIDEAVDNYNTALPIESIEINQEHYIKLIDSKASDEESQKKAMVVYTSVLLVENGFELSKLPFLQKIIYDFS